jgi:hypothetical protein
VEVRVLSAALLFTRLFVVLAVEAPSHRSPP